MPKASYRVHYFTRVDRPERRDPSFPVVPAGTLVQEVVQAESYTAAVNLYEGLRAGSYDNSAEYVSSVYVARVTQGGNEQSCARRRVSRARVGAGDEVQEFAS